MELKRVVVTGLGAITPLGNTMPETWENIKRGKSGGGKIVIDFSSDEEIEQFIERLRNK